MKKAAILLSVVFITVLFGSCVFTGGIEGNGNVVEETRDLGDFNQIGVSRGMNVYITQGSQTKVVVIADENLIKTIETTVDDNMLKVTCNRWIRKSKSLQVRVTVPNIELIKTTSGSNVYAEDTLQMKMLSLKSTAGSNIKLLLNTGELDISATAGSNIFLSGTTRKMTMKANSGSNIKAGELKTELCSVKASSGANIWVIVQSELNASVSSGANLFYYGEPNPLRVTKSSGGNVIKK